MQIIKLEERVRKTKDEVVKCDRKYKQAQQLINKYKPVYIEDMALAFAKCQEMEEKRLRFFKKVFFSLQKTLNVTQDPKYANPFHIRDAKMHLEEFLSNYKFYFQFISKCSLPQIYEEFYHTIDKVIDHQKDLDWWSKKHGVKMSMNWPSFVVHIKQTLV